MPVSFSTLKIGQSYERPFLAKLWGYRGFQAISRGVVTPAGSNIIILFVTEEKQESLTQYRDYLDGDSLHWEGEKKHASDDRVIRASESGDEIHLFHRKVHHSPFIYMGPVSLQQHNRLVDSPSQFIFELGSGKEVREEVADYAVLRELKGSRIPQTEINAVVKSRLGQGVFRDGLLRLWGGCAVTGYGRPSLLLASHIKPWRTSSNSERLDPYNGLLLQPTIDRLFDKGLVSFDRRGKILRAPDLTADELVCLGVNPNGVLRKLPKATAQYLNYHREHEFCAYNP